MEKSWSNGIKLKTLAKGSSLRFRLCCPSKHGLLSVADRLEFSVEAKLGKCKPECANECK